MNYTVGPSFKTVKPIERRHLISICKDLAAAMPNGITFEPEPITEGGIVYKFKNLDLYKSIRFIAMIIDLDTGDITRIVWPRVSDTVMKDWESSRTELFPVGMNLSTLLKVSCAPAFSSQELHIVCEIFKKYGLVQTD